MTRAMPIAALRAPAPRVRIVAVLAAGVVLAVVAGLTGRSIRLALPIGLLGAIAAAGWLSVGLIRPSKVPVERRRAAGRIAIAVLAAGIGGVLLAAAIGLAIAPGPFVLAPAETTGYRPTYVAALMIALLGLLLGARAAHDTITGPRTWVRITITSVVVVAALAFQLRLAWAVLQYGTYDSMQVFNAAYTSSVAPFPDFYTEHVRNWYFQMLPNNDFLAAAWSMAFAGLKGLGLVGVTNYLWVSVLVNVLAIDVTVALIWFVARRIGDRFTTSITLAGAFALIVISPYLDVPYSDTLGFVFPIGAVALFLAWPTRWPHPSRLALWGLLGAITAVGYAVKPTIVFAAAGLLVAELLRTSGRPATRIIRVLGPAAAFGVVLLAGHLAIPGWIDSTGTFDFKQSANRDALPFAHFMAMGATGDGGFNQADVNSSLTTPFEGRSAADLALYLGRVGEMGLVGYPLFLGKKLLYAFSDGTFYQDREGMGPYDRSFFNHDPLSSLAQAIYPNSAPLHWALSTGWQAVWFLVVLLCLVPIGSAVRGDRRSILIAMRVSVLLMLTFLLFSESRSRYLYLYLPFMLVLAGLGARALTDRAGRLVARIRAGATNELAHRLHARIGPSQS